MKDTYPLPHIGDSLATLSGSCWFSTLDLASGYWQVEVREEDRPKTAFTTGSGLYQFTVMPFELCNAPAPFERLMERVLSGLPWEVCLLYLDDIIAHPKTFEAELDQLHSVFTRLQEAGLKLSPKICHLFKKRVVFLGHVVSEDGVPTEPDKIQAVCDWPANPSLGIHLAQFPVYLFLLPPVCPRLCRHCSSPPPFECLSVRAVRLILLESQI